MNDRPADAGSQCRPPSVVAVNRARFRLLALVLALGFGVASCGSDDSEATATSENSSDEAAMAVGAGLLDISAPAADGSTIDLSDFAGEDLMMWFWAPW